MSNETAPSNLALRPPTVLGARTHRLALRMSRDLRGHRRRLGLFLRWGNAAYMDAYLEELSRRLDDVTPILLSSPAEVQAAVAMKTIDALLTDDSTHLEHTELPLLFVSPYPAEATDLAAAWDQRAAMTTVLAGRSPCDWDRVAAAVRTSLIRKDLVTAGTEHRRVLWADDEGQIRDVLARALPSWDMEPTLARDGEQALRLIEAPGAEFDVIVSDCRMPKLSGPALFNRIAPRVQGRVPLVMEVCCDQTREWCDALSAAALGAVQSRVQLPGVFSEIRATLEHCLGLRDAMRASRLQRFQPSDTR